MSKTTKSPLASRTDLGNAELFAALFPHPQSTRVITDPQELRRSIELIRKRICAEFHLAEMRDPDLKVRSHRQVYAFPRQLAMHIARQVTGVSLEEIGRLFGGRHHTTVLHSINKIEAMRRSDEALNHIIMQTIRRSSGLKADSYHGTPHQRTHISCQLPVPCPKSGRIFGAHRSWTTCGTGTNGKQQRGVSRIRHRSAGCDCQKSWCCPNLNFHR